MMIQSEKPILPVWFRVGVVGMILTTLLISFSHRFTHSDERDFIVQADNGAVVESRALHFVDLDGGLVSVVAADTQQEITRLEIGEGGFMRSVMRGLARERLAKGFGPEIPFELTVWESGLVSLIDPATERRVELSAFGKDNVAAFTRLLSEAEPDRRYSHSSS